MGRRKVKEKGGETSEEDGTEREGNG